MIVYVQNTSEFPKIIAKLIELSNVPIKVTGNEKLEDSMKTSFIFRK